MRITPEAKGAAGDGITDDTQAVQAAFSTGYAVQLPGKYRITAPIVLATVDQVVEGDGFSSQLLPCGPIKAFVSNTGLVRIIARDFAVLGGPETDDAFDLSSGTLYESEFNNLHLWTGGRAIYAPINFSTRLTGLQFNSHNANGIELGGGNTTRFDSCYAHTFAPGKYAYRLYGGAQMVSCNSLDAGDNIILAGAGTTRGDATNNLFRLLCQNCNFEDYKVAAVRLRFTGQAIFEACTFLAPSLATSPTYECAVHLEYTDQLVLFEGGTVGTKGSVRTRKADLYSEGGAAPLCIGITDQWDDNGVLTSIPNLKSAQAAYAKFGLKAQLVS